MSAAYDRDNADEAIPGKDPRDTSDALFELEYWVTEALTLGATLDDVDEAILDGVETFKDREVLRQLTTLFAAKRPI